MRRASREYVFKLVFEFTFYGSVNDDTLDLFLTDADLNDEDKEYIRERYDGVTANLDSLKAKVRHGEVRRLCQRRAGEVCP